MERECCIKFVAIMYTAKRGKLLSARSSTADSSQAIQICCGGGEKWQRRSGHFKEGGT